MNLHKGTIFNNGVFCTYIEKMKAPVIICITCDPSMFCWGPTGSLSGGCIQKNGGESAYYEQLLNISHSNSEKAEFHNL